MKNKDNVFHCGICKHKYCKSKEEPCVSCDSKNNYIEDANLKRVTQNITVALLLTIVIATVFVIGFGLGYDLSNHLGPFLDRGV